MSATISCGARLHSQLGGAMKEFRCDSGKIYNLPDEACVFCQYCTDIFWDYSHGIYMLLCEKSNHAVDFGNVPCICKDFMTDENV